MIIEEIRIYYESTEQGCDFVLPILQKILKLLDKKIPIKCIKLIGNYKVYSKRIAPIIYWKDTDCLISIIVDKKEYPLSAIEFSQAVFTEDHELQRFDAITSAITNETISIKISSVTKQSGSSHGGDTNFNYLLPFTLAKNNFAKYAFHIDWPCTLPDTLAIDSKSPSCPPRLDNFENLLTITFSAIFDMKHLDDRLVYIFKSLKNNSFFEKWFTDIDSAITPDVTTFNSSRKKWIQNDPYFKKDIFELKINRMGHAMDPERGMIPYYGILSKSLVTKMCFTTQSKTWYSALQGATNRIDEYLVNNGLNTPFDFLTCFAMGTSLYNNDEFKKILKSVEHDKSDPLVLDISNFVTNSFLNLNKALRTIFAFSDSFILEDDSGKRRVIFNFQKQTVSLNFFENYPEITPIQNDVKFTEDEVSYTVIHNIFPKNNLPILSASYPGAQGDRAILVNPSSGRKQSREYVDVLSGKSNKTIVCENKGSYKKQDITNDIEKIKSFKTPEYDQAIKNFHLKFQTGINHMGIITGVAFWINTASEESLLNDLNLKDIDFLILLSSDMKTWKIIDLTKSKVFSSLSGDVSLPHVYSIIPIKERKKKT